MSHNYRNPKAIGAGLTAVVSGLDWTLPATLTLTSADATRKIELTTDGTNWYQPTYDATVTGMINVVVRGPVNAARFTGLATDTYGVV